MSPRFIETKRSELARICVEHDISYHGLFGSYARGEQRPDSDVDLLVDFSVKKSLFGVAAAQLDFEDELHRKVDLVIRRSIKKPRLIANINRDLVTLYERS